ncbi:velvet factor [Phlyctochytrium arcticum]|nr:velvet factor [Phlyctochytrium arcticum]
MAAPALQSTSSTGLFSDGSFTVILRQQPCRARMCGFSDTKDRRLIDPPPVLQLLLRDKDGRDIPARSTDSARWVCHVSLFSPDGTKDRNIVINPRGGNISEELIPGHTRHRQTDTKDHTLVPTGSDTHNEGDSPERKSFRPWFQSSAPSPAPPSSNAPSFDPSRYFQSLVGSTVVPCEILSDVNGEVGMFFVFHDISVRTQGLFRLKLLVVHLDWEGSQSETKASILTDTFEVFPPKTFPGMTESTALSKCFARQGVPIHIRKDYSTIPEPAPNTLAWHAAPASCHEDSPHRRPGVSSSPNSSSLR